MTALYPLREAARAANTTTRTLRRWLDHNVVTLRGIDKKSTGSGDCVGLSRARALQVAITQQLLSTGLSLSTAANAALEFTDFGNEGRAASDLFQTGKTWLVIESESTVVMNADFDAAISEISRRGVSVVVVDLNQLVGRVDASLNSYQRHFLK